MLKLKLSNSNHSGLAALVIDDIVKDIRQDENLTTDLESSSLLWKVTIPHDSAAIPVIVNEEEWQAQLYDETSGTVTSFFTGYLSESINWTIDQNGQNSLQVTLEDKGVHLLKAPFTKDESIVISGKFSYEDTETDPDNPEYGVVQQICNVAGITWASDITVDTTEVKHVAAKAETCESLLKSLCKEMCMAYSFNTLGELYLIPLSAASIAATDTADDTSLYDSIILSKKTVNYKGSRVEWDELATINNTLIYRDISNQSTIHPNCFIELEAGNTYPSPDGAITYYKATDLAHGAEVFSITNVNPTVHWWDGSGTYQIQQSGADEIAILITGSTSGNIDKLQATANLTYIKSKNIIYGDSGSITESLKEEKCKWIHNEAAAKKYANFLAQYYKYCSRTFTFKTKKTYRLGEIIQLYENIHTGLTTYLMITKRVRTLTDYDTANKAFSGMWSYEAVSTSAFNYNKPVTTESLWIPPTDTYVEVPDVSGIVLELSDFRLDASPSNLIANRRRTDTQTIRISTTKLGYTGTPTIRYWFSDGDPDNPWEFVADSVTVSIPYNHNHPELCITASLQGAPPQSLVLSTIDETEEYHYFGECNIDTSGYYNAEGEPDPALYNQVDWSEIEDQIETNEQFLDGDSFFNKFSNGSFNDVYIYVYQQGYWVPISFSNYSNSIRSRICMQAQKDVLSTIETGSVTQSDFGYFNTIIAGTVTAEYIGGKEIEVHDGGFIYAGDVDITQPAGQRVGSSGAGFCFDSIGNAEMANIRITGDSTIEGGSTVLGTLINYDSNGLPVFRTRKEDASGISMSGSKTDGTDAPSAYIWSEFFNYFNTQITSNLTDGTAYNATGTIRGTWSSSVASKTIRAVKYYATAPSTAFSQDPQYGMINGITGDLNSNQVETKTIWTNTGKNTVHFDHVTAYPKTESGPFGTQTQAGAFSIDVCNSGGSIRQTFINAGTQGPSGSTGGFERTASNIDVPPGCFIQARWGTWGWSRRGSHGWVKLYYRDSDNFTQGINLIVSNGDTYNANNVIPNLSSYSTHAQSLTVTGTSVSFNIAMTAASSWPFEKYYRFAYSQAPGNTTAVTTSIFSSKSFSYKGNTKTVISATFNNSMLKLIDSAGATYEFYTAQGYYYPQYAFSFSTRLENLGAYMRSAMPSDDTYTHDVGGRGNYSSGNEQRWDTGFFTSLDVSQGIIAQTINAGWNAPLVTANTTITDDIPVGFMKPYFLNSSSDITLTMPGNSSQQYVVLCLNVLVGALVTAGKVPRYIAINGGASTTISWLSSAEPYMLVYIYRLS